MTAVSVNKVPPDGGYGWVIVFSYGLNNVMLLPVIGSFGLVFKEAMSDVGLDHSQGSLVIILNYTVGALLSLFGGPILSRFSYRKVAVIGAIFISLGLLITSVASSFWMFILSYSIISSMGITALMAAFSLAINSFFKEKRVRAMGVAMSITGLGAILMPFIMSALLTAFSWRYAVLTLSAICLHSLVAACLLRPVKWYLQYPPPHSEERVPLSNDFNVDLIKQSLVSKDNGISSQENAPPPKSASMIYLASAASLQVRNAMSHPDLRKISSKVKAQLNIFKEQDRNNRNVKDDSVKEEQQKNLFGRFVDFFDLTLLKDPVFVNILFGLSIAACAETNFFMLLPIIIQDMMKFETEDIAILLAIIGISDTVFRLVARYSPEWCKKSPRVVFLVSLFLSIFIRTVMLFTSSFLGMVFVTFAMGFVKGARMVYMYTIIPDYVPVERLPYANGVQMFVNGIITFSIGSVLAGNVNKVPPDGGYGWVIVFSYALNTVMVLTLVNNFGLVFKEAMSDVGLSHTQGGLVIVLNQGFGNLLSFLGGPILRRFGYRKVAVVGAIFYSLGFFCTAGASSFWMFIVFYSIISSLGIAALMSAFTLAINSFFKEKRGRAIGTAMTITGLGATLVPLLMSALLTAFGWRYTVLTLSAITLNTLVAASLLRPAKWYLRYPPHSEEVMPLNKDTNGEPFKETKTESTISIANATGVQAKNVMANEDVYNKSSKILPNEIRYKMWESQEINLGSSINIFNEQLRKKSDVKHTLSVKGVEQKKSIYRRLVDFFDLTLLKDPIFVNILLGLTFGLAVEINFVLLLPIILQDMMKFETEEIARLMAVIACADTLFRFAAPFIGEWCNKPPRFMYMFSLLLMIIIRTTMLFTSSFMGMVFVALAMGASRGIRTVYLFIVVPNYLPIERLPCAWGIQMLINGTLTISIGSLLGRLRESSGTYHMPLVVMNFIILLTVTSWVAEYLYLRAKNNNLNKS